MGKNLDSPFLDSESDKMLANELADFFMEKIMTIRDSLEAYPIYDPQATAKTFMCKFEQVAKKGVTKCIREMASKSFELDTIPTTTLKQVLDTVIELITRIVNVLLESGIFALKSNAVIVHPLHKKAGLDLILSNFRPVSSLSFISKLVEKMVLKQFNKHCGTHKLIPDYHSAYRANFSCETALASSGQCSTKKSLP